uniref:Immunoglobulin domain-containing protein n=1 Tax=Sinocyclocheilus rhinocerous TaxID=307959 RepID=A0A673I8K1_9TELE
VDYEIRFINDNFILFYLFVYFCQCNFYYYYYYLFAGAFGESVSVTEGDSVTLHTALLEIQKDDVIQWRFGADGALIAQINRATRKVFKYDDADKRFRHRLKLDYLTGSLTIKNIGTNHSGLYEVDISTSSIKHTIHKTFNVTVSGEMKTVSVMEGESVTLHTDDTEVQSNDLILWMFRDTVIAEINKTAQIFYIYNGDNGQFRDKLKLNNQTGSLTITECKTSNSGLYELNINMFIITEPRLSSGEIAGMVVVLLVFATIVAVVIYYRWKISKLKCKYYS